MVRWQKSMTPAEFKLKEVYVNLWGPHNPPSLSGSTYVSILVCEKMWKLWILYLRSQNEFVDTFQIWFPRLENKSKCSLKTLCADGGGEFIFIKLRVFCKNRRIALKYVAPYIYKKNKIAEKRWQTIVIMKDSLLLDSRLPLDFWTDVIDTANYLQNRLPIKSQRGEPISKKVWSDKQQNVSHLKVLGNFASIEIPKKSVIRPTSKRIGMVYSSAIATIPTNISEFRQLKQSNCLLSLTRIS